jgi:transposase
MVPASLLLPDATCLRLVSIQVIDTQHTLSLEVTAAQPTARCPTCGCVTTRVHSHYQRTLADLPIAGWRVHLHLGVRKFRCTNRACSQRIFCERLPTVTAPWARRTLRLAAAQRAIGLALGGAAGARLAATLALPTGRDALLALVRCAPCHRSAAPTHVGIDDWAWRKGHTYATIVVDLDTHRPLALLPDRSPECVAQWLQQHPDVELVSRDRWNGYIDGITVGAPAVTQVADRFHLLKNLGDTLVRIFQQHQRAIARQVQTVPAPSATGAAACVATTVPPSTPTPRVRRRAREQAERAARRQTRIAHAHRLHAQGWLQRAIAAHLGLHPRTIRRYLRQDPAATEPVRRRKRHGLLDPYRTYLLARWNAGCRNAVQLFHELQAQGYRGQLTILRNYLAEVRHAQGIPPYVRWLPPGDVTPVVPPPRPPTPRYVAGLILKHATARRPEEQALIEQVRQVNPDLTVAVALAQDFATIVRARQSECLDAWLERAAASGISAFQNFAAGLRQDAAAVHAALRLPYSNGPVEGQINRLKLLKRQGYGRAKLDLLERRLLAG